MIFRKKTKSKRGNNADVADKSSIAGNKLRQCARKDRPYGDLVPTNAPYRNQLRARLPQLRYLPSSAAGPIATGQTRQRTRRYGNSRKFAAPSDAERLRLCHPRARRPLVSSGAGIAIGGSRIARCQAGWAS